MRAFYKQVNGTYVNNFSNRFGGLLPELSVQKVEEIDAEVFNWASRKHRLVQEMLRDDPDVLVLEELDEFDFFKEQLDKKGYDGIWQKRPRPDSKDGCAIFWRASRFKLLGNKSHEMYDLYQTKGPRSPRMNYHRIKNMATLFKYIPRIKATATINVRQDRIALLAALEDQIVKKRRLLVAAVHLQRNPEDVGQAVHRNLEVRQLQHHIEAFSREYGLSLFPGDDAISDALVVTGDFNSDQDRSWNPKDYADAHDESWIESTSPEISELAARAWSESIDAGAEANYISALAAKLHLPGSESAKLSSAFSLRSPKFAGDEAVPDWTPNSAPAMNSLGDHELDDPQQYLDGDWSIPDERNPGEFKLYPAGHPDYFSASMDGCTTKTDSREMWIDHVFYSCQTLQVKGLFKDPCPFSGMPNAQNPSDHLPVAVKFEWQSLDQLGPCNQAVQKITRFSDPKPAFP